MSCSALLKIFLLFSAICLLSIFLFVPTQKLPLLEFYDPTALPRNKTIPNAVYWQPAIPSQLYVHSATYALPAENLNGYVIKVIAIVNRKDPGIHAAISCSCVCPYGTFPALLADYPEHHGEPYTAATLTCDVRQYADFTRTIRMTLQCQMRSVSGSVELDVAPPPAVDPPALSMAMCGPVIFGQDVRPERIVEWVEYYRIMGVSKFFIPVYYTSPFFSNVTAEVLRVLRYYEDRELVEVGNWTIPVEIERKMHYNGQLAAVNECMMKAYRYFDYVVVVDFDEYIISQHGTGLDAIVQKGSRDCVTVRHAAVKTSLSATAPPGDISQHLVRHLHRDSKIWNINERTKYICRPRCVLEAGVHFIHKSRPNTRLLVGANTEETLVLHFSEGLIGAGAPLVDVDMERFFGLARLQRLTDTVNTVYRSIFNSTGGVKYIWHKWRK
ncbi:beta-1,4-galactosyltransferase galt-1-like [Paramacrobiotus metropolitanus]|uniref:beta-1,4-galactosyltransferase galt-1-like n=1 Tax=Paramacrobiotus metropolitanus TaxID=2943436 RepID=UPI00244656B2|nr:beta-1,4-galactosyltransferase galt-1-like [Paramacrobiotus metropolitanus]